MIAPDPEPPDWLRALTRPPAEIPASATRPAPLLIDAEHRPIASVAAWQERRATLIREWLAFLGEIRVPRPSNDLTVLEEDRRDGVLRQLVRYDAEPGLPVEGYLLRPLEPGRGRRGVVVLHSTVDHTIHQPAGLDGPADKHLGLQLARRGDVAFCPRCFLWQYAGPGRYGAAVDWLRQRHPGITGMAKMLFDARRAVDILVSQPDVSPHRLGAVGHSLGAKEVLYLAAFDPRVRAAVSSEGGIGLSYSNWDAPWYLGEAIRRPGFDLDHGQILALAAPRAFLLIGGDSADGAISWPYVEAVLPVWKLQGAGDAVGLLNHHQGHSFPAPAQEHTERWLEWFLPAPPADRPSP